MPEDVRDETTPEMDAEVSTEEMTETPEEVTTEEGATDAEGFDAEGTEPVEEDAEEGVADEE